MQLVGASGTHLQFSKNRFGALDPLFGFGDQFGATRLDRIDFPFQSDPNRVELAGGDAKARQKLALKVVECSTGTQGGKEASLGSAVQAGVVVQHLGLRGIEQQSGLVGEDGPLRHHGPRLPAKHPTPFGLDSSQNACRRVEHTSRR